MTANPNHVLSFDYALGVAIQAIHTVPLNEPQDVEAREDFTRINSYIAELVAHRAAGSFPCFNTLLNLLRLVEQYQVGTPPLNTIAADVILTVQYLLIRINHHADVEEARILFETELLVDLIFNPNRMDVDTRRMLVHDLLAPAPQPLGAHEVDCPICMMMYEEDQPVVLPCGHMGHGKCLEKWLMGNVTCPMCRRDYGEKLSGRDVQIEIGDINGGAGLDGVNQNLQVAIDNLVGALEEAINTPIVPRILPDYERGDMNDEEAGLADDEANSHSDNETNSDSDGDADNEVGSEVVASRDEEQSTEDEDSSDNDDSRAHSHDSSRSQGFLTGFQFSSGSNDDTDSQAGVEDGTDNGVPDDWYDEIDDSLYDDDDDDDDDNDEDYNDEHEDDEMVIEEGEPISDEDEEMDDVDGIEKEVMRYFETLEDETMDELDSIE